jgi:predicted nucleotidyltransferase
MARSRPQSALRYPLTTILGADAQVRVLRELAGHGGTLSAPNLVQRTGLAASSVREALGVLQRTDVVEAVGSGRTWLYRLQKEHPIGAALQALFWSEQGRFDSIIETVRLVAAGTGPGLVAVWLYGSAARGTDRPGSDLDIAVACEPDSLSRIREGVRDGLQEAERQLGFCASVVAVDTDDVLRHDADRDPWWTSVVRDALVLLGPRPEELAGRLRRTRAARERQAS